MLIIGLTGASGAGKGLFAQTAHKYFGALHIDTDKLARQVVMPGQECLHKIAECFGENILCEDGSLNRKELAKVVFSDKQKLELLNSITHPAITLLVRDILKDAQSSGTKIAIIDAPLLFESGEDSVCDITVGVVAQKDIRLKRIMKRDSIDEKAAESRLISGKDTKFFVDRCDYILENNYDEPNEFAEKCRELISAIISSAPGTKTKSAK